MMTHEHACDLLANFDFTCQQFRNAMRRNEIIEKKKTGKQFFSSLFSFPFWVRNRNSVGWKTSRWISHGLCGLLPFCRKWRLLALLACLLEKKMKLNSTIFYFASYVEEIAGGVAQWSWHPQWVAIDPGSNPARVKGKYSSAVVKMDLCNAYFA
jgi:hypothetical protein